MPISKTISGATILWKAIGGKLALQELLPKRPTEMVGHHCSLLQSHNGWCIDNVKVQLFHCQRSSPPSTLSLPSAYADSLFASRSASPRPRIGLPRYHPMLLWLPGAGPINMSARLPSWSDGLGLGLWTTSLCTAISRPRFRRQYYYLRGPQIRLFRCGLSSYYLWDFNKKT